MHTGPATLRGRDGIISSPRNYFFFLRELLRGWEKGHGCSLLRRQEAEEETPDLHSALWGVLFTAVGSSRIVGVLRGGEGIVGFGCGPCLFHGLYGILLVLWLLE